MWFPWGTIKNCGLSVDLAAGDAGFFLLDERDGDSGFGNDDALVSDEPKVWPLKAGDFRRERFEHSID